MLHRAHAMPISHLPLDLWWLIIDIAAEDVRIEELTSETYQVLRACVLTCSEWLPQAQRNLYHFVWINGAKHSRSFAGTMTSSPHLGSLVREVRFRHFRRSDTTPHALPEDAVRQLTHLQLFAFDATVFFPILSSRNEMLLALRHCPELRTVAFYNCDWPPPGMLKGAIYVLPRTVRTIRVVGWAGTWPPYDFVSDDHGAETWGALSRPTYETLRPPRLEVSISG